MEESPAIAFVYKEAAAQGINASERLFFAQCPHLPSLRAPLRRNAHQTLPHPRSLHSLRAALRLCYDARVMLLTTNERDKSLLIDQHTPPVGSAVKQNGEHYVIALLRIVAYS